MSEMVQIDATLEIPIVIGAVTVAHLPDLEVQLDCLMLDDLCQDPWFDLHRVRVGAVSITEADIAGDANATAIWRTAESAMRNDANLRARLVDHTVPVFDDFSDLRVA